MRVKYCGITRMEDAIYAERMGAHAIGVVVNSNSKREISIEKAKKIFSGLVPYITKVCVTSSKSRKGIKEALSTKPDAIQIYTNPEDLELILEDVVVIQSISKLETVHRNADAILIDNSMGSGKEISISSEFELIKKIDEKNNFPFILAGGLKYDNLNKFRKLISYSGFYALDVSSGIESSPGIKDRGKMRKFMKNFLRCFN